MRESRVFNRETAVQNFARAVYSVMRELRADEAGCCRFQPPLVRELRVHGSSPRAGGGEVCGEGRGQGLRRLHRLLLPAFQQHAGRCVMWIMDLYTGSWMLDKEITDRFVVVGVLTYSGWVGGWWWWW